MLRSVVGKYVVLSWRIFLANLSSALSFRMSFLLSIVGLVVFFSGQFFMWTIFFNQFPSIGGWTSKEFILVYSLYLFSVAILDVFAGGIKDLASDISAGNLDYFLAFPKPILWHLSVSKSDVISISTLALSLCCFLLSGPIDMVRVVTFFCASVFSIILLFDFYVTTQSIAFFVGGFDMGASMTRHLLGIVSTYPFAIFPYTIKFMLITIIPSFFIVTMPAKLVNDFSLTNLTILCSACILFSIIARFVFKAGLKRYESGNMINVRP